MEAPGLDFGGFWDHFFEIWGLWARKMQELSCNLKLKLRNSSLELELANHEGLFYHNSWNTNRRAAVVPPRGFQSAAHRGRARHCASDTDVKFCYLCFLKILSRDSSLAQEGSEPLSFSLPRRRGGSPQTRSQKNGKIKVVSNFSSIL